jgi:hypothetical protein
MTHKQAAKKLQSVWAYLNWMFPVDDTYYLQFQAMRIVSQIQDEYKMLSCLSYDDCATINDKWRTQCNYADSRR